MRAIIAAKRDGAALSRAQIDAFVAGVTDGSWSDAQVAAFAMATFLRGMTDDETLALTDAMTRSGDTLDWSGAGLNGPLLDKHSTGGVGDKVSLLLAPVVAACGGVVPMVSGRGLGHTGGTLDKLESLPGYSVDVTPQRMAAVLRDCGCAIVAASARLAPADRRLYAIRDLTATVESVPLITASILSKKRAAGLAALVLDVKAGSGAFAQSLDAALELARSLVTASRAAGLPARAIVTDMSQVLGTTAGNALEVGEALAALTRPAEADRRLIDVTLGLAAELLQLGGLYDTVDAAHVAARRALDGGAAADRFARMVAALGGPRDVLRDAQLPAAPVWLPVPAVRAGFVAAIDVRAVGLAVLALGGGRRLTGDTVDARVGCARIAGLGQRVGRGDALAVVHAADAGMAAAGAAALAAAMTIADTAPPALPWLRAMPASRIGS